MKNRVFKIAFIIIMFIISVNFSVVNADMFNDIITQGNNFDNADSDDGLGRLIADFINGKIGSSISLVGNLVFAGVTVILGAKYIWSGFDGKSQVKETLPTFVAAVVFFYLATEITALFSPNNSGSIGAAINGVTQYNSLASMIIGTINLIVKFLSVAGIVFIGLKYMFESAEGKANIKDKLVPMVLGLVLVYSATTFVDFIINTGKEIIS